MALVHDNKIASFQNIVSVNSTIIKSICLIALHCNFFVLLHSDLPILEHNQNPSDSYEHLRKIVHTIAQEVIKLPEFYNQKGFSSVDAKQVQSSFEPKVYEDLLATAVINKVKQMIHYRNNVFECQHSLFMNKYVSRLYYKKKSLKRKLL